MIWKVTHKGGIEYIEAITRSGAKVMAKQMGLNPPFSCQPAPNYDGPTTEAYFNTNHGGGILDLKK